MADNLVESLGILDEIRKSKEGLQNRSSSITDVYDGKVYKEHFNQSGFYHGTTELEMKNQLHLSLQINTDGVAIFRSSKFGVWPVYAVINELSPKSRFTRENRLLIGLWFGNQKPNMELLLKPVLNEMDLLFKGAPIATTGLIVRAVILSAVADAPARCLLMNFVQFNGNYGCPCCYAKGETFAISEKGNSHIYPYELNDQCFDQGHARLRTKEESKQYAEQVEQQYLAGKRKDPQPEQGVKGISMLYFFPEFDMVRGMAVDYMHCVLLGVVKMMIGLWTDQEHKDKNWSIRSSIDAINNRLKCISPPNLISRMPRGIDEYHDWKASEFRSFLLFYSLPVLSNILTTEYHKHFSNLVKGTFLLLKTSISRRDLAIAKCCFKQFCIGVEKMYGERYATFNVHSLLHLVTKVEDLGPLWTQSCFFYEGLNGDLRSQFHGTQQIDLQIITAVSVQQKIPEMVGKLVSEPVCAFYEHMSKGKKSKSDWNLIAPGTYVVGTSKRYEPTCYEFDELQKKFGSVSEIRKYHRIFHTGSLICSKDYKPVKRRNSYTVKCETGVYQVLFYVQCATDNGYRHGALVEELVPSSQCGDHIEPVSYGLKTVIRLNEIKELLVFIDIDAHQKFVAQFPNSCEKD